MTYETKKYYISRDTCESVVNMGLVTTDYQAHKKN